MAPVVCRLPLICFAFARSALFAMPRRKKGRRDDSGSLRGGPGAPRRPEVLRAPSPGAPPLQTGRSLFSGRQRTETKTTKQREPAGSLISATSHQIPSPQNFRVWKGRNPDALTHQSIGSVRGGAMSSAQDPFYTVREEIQDSIDKLQSTFHRWEQTALNTGEYVHLTKELLTSCESIEWQVDELAKTISVASRDPSYYGLDEVELSRRRNWTGSAHNQVGTVRRTVEKGKSNSAMSKHLGTSRANLYSAQDNDDFISSESDRQLLLIRQQDEELDELSASVERIGGVGLTIHEELTGQERILNDLSLEMETTSNRLDFVQKRVAMVMKKAGIKGQIMLIVFLVVLFIILFVLVFLT